MTNIATYLMLMACGVLVLFYSLLVPGVQVIAGLLAMGFFMLAYIVIRSSRNG